MVHIPKRRVKWIYCNLLLTDCMIGSSDAILPTYSISVVCISLSSRPAVLYSCRPGQQRKTNITGPTSDFLRVLYSRRHTSGHWPPAATDAYEDDKGEKMHRCCTAWDSLDRLVACRDLRCYLWHTDRCSHHAATAATAAAAIRKLENVDARN